MPGDDIWSRIAKPASSSAAAPSEWLIRQGPMVLGPMATNVVITKILQGTILGQNMIAPDGGDNYLPIAELELFRPHVEKALALQAARKSRMRLLLLASLFIVLAVAGGGVFFAFKKGLIGPKRAADKKTIIVSGQKGSDVSTHEVADLKLVALVDIDSAEKGLKIRGKKKRPARNGTPDKPGQKMPDDDEPDEGPTGCLLSQDVIFGVVKRSLPQWRVCIQSLAETQPEAMPPTLHIGFVVSTDGSLKDFEILNRDLRKGAFRNCMFKFFSALRFPPSKGSNCTVDDWPIPLKR